MEKVYYTDGMFKIDMKNIKLGNINSKYEAVFAPYRGGLTMGTKISHMLNIPLGIIDYQRLDSNKAGDQKVRMAIEPVGRDLEDGMEIPFWKMRKVLLVDDICDTGKSIEKIYRFIKIVNPDVQIDIICIYGNLESSNYLHDRIKDESFELKFLRDNDGKWIVFETWEDEFKGCGICENGEPCNKWPETKIHCALKNKSFEKGHKCISFRI